MVVTLTVWDPTLPPGNNGLQLICFSPTRSGLPQVRRPGDIIRVHRAYTQVWDEKAQLVLKANMANKAAFIVFDGEGGSEEPYQCSSPETYTFTENDTKTLQYLRNIRAEADGAGAAAGGPSGQGTRGEFLQRVCDLDPHAGGEEELTTADVECMVVLSCGPDKYPGLPEGCKLLFIWDGTDILPQIDRTDVGLERLPLELADRELDGFARRDLPLDFVREREPMGDVPWLGSIVPVVIFTETTPSFTPPGRGAGVVLRKVGVVSADGQVQLVFLPGSRWSNLPGNTLSSMVTAYNKRKNIRNIAQHAPKHDPNAMPTQVTAHKMPHTSLRQVLRDGVCGNRQSRTFRCLVRVVQISPTSVEEFCVSDAAANKRKRSRSVKSKYSFLVRFELEDATSNLFAHLKGDEAAKFFGVEPANLADKNDARAVSAKAAIENKISVLRRPQKGGTWIDCVLLQHYPRVKAGSPLKVEHLIVRTRVVQSLSLGEGELTQPVPAGALQFV